LLACLFACLSVITVGLYIITCLNEGELCGAEDLPLTTGTLTKSSSAGSNRLGDCLNPVKAGAHVHPVLLLVECKRDVLAL
jgi:hypothetical protein